MKPEEKSIDKKAPPRPDKRHAEKKIRDQKRDEKRTKPPLPIEKQNELVDNASEDSFPASDPPAYTPIKGIESKE